MHLKEDMVCNNSIYAELCEQWSVGTPVCGSLMVVPGQAVPPAQQRFPSPALLINSVSGHDGALSRCPRPREVAGGQGHRRLDHMPRS